MSTDEIVGIRQPGRPALAMAATDLYAEPPLSAVLGQLLKHSRRLVGAMAGSVSLVDAGHDRYAKLAEYGASCQLGRSFPLAEGVTGQVMTRRRPVVLGSYRDVRTGHLPLAHPASRGAVAAVPIWWLGEVIGANVVFGGGRGAFSSTEVDELELLTQVAAPGIAKAGQPDGATGIAVARPPGGSARSPLTAREAEVLELLGHGLTDHEIGAVLGISRKTVEKHVGAILRKCGAARRTTAVVRGLERGWLDLGSDSGR